MISKRKDLFRLIATLVIVSSSAIVIFLVDWGVVSDWAHSLDFQPTTEVAELTDDLALTQRARIMLMASRPTIKPSDSFNQACSAANQEVSVLGCYNGSNIYIYDVKNPELSGIKQSTLAHELLHAAWSRLSTQEQNKLRPELEAVYAANQPALSSRLDLYSKDVFHEELHSIVGTEFAELSDPLENHYRKYFSDQDAVVAFFTRYDAKFKALKQEADTLFAEIEANQQAITNLSAEYQAVNKTLSAAIEDFNQRAQNGYFTSIATFNAERATLVARQRAAEDLYEQISALINTTNDKISAYNNNVARTQNLVNSINSHTEQTPTID